MRRSPPRPLSSSARSRRTLLAHFEARNEYTLFHKAHGEACGVNIHPRPRHKRLGTPEPRHDRQKPGWCPVLELARCRCVVKLSRALPVRAEGTGVVHRNALRLDFRRSLVASVSGNVGGKRPRIGRRHGFSPCAPRVGDVIVPAAERQRSHCSPCDLRV